MADENLGKLMDEYDTLLQTISRIESDITRWGRQMSDLSRDLVTANQGRFRWSRNPPWEVTDAGIKNRYGRSEDGYLSRDAIGRLCDSLQELENVGKRKDEIDGTLKRMGRESLIQQTRSGM